MQLRHLKSILQGGESANRIYALAWSPNGQKLAVCGQDRIVQIFDETGERKDRFATKPADPKTGNDYTIVALAFSPDSTRLAVAQSDAVVFVYKLGLEWGEKKSICNKFVQNCEVTCLAWPRSQQNALVFGLSDGKVRVGNLKTNKAATLYETESFVVSAASSPDGTAIMTGHLDGSIYRFYFDDGASGASQGKFVSVKAPPFALAWGESIVVGGTDSTVTMFDVQNGRQIVQFDYSNDEEEQEFCVAEISPSGQSVVVGSFNRIHVYNYNGRKSTWDKAPLKVVENFYSVTALSWKPDAAKLVVGNLCGAVELFDCCLKRARYKGKFEFTYVSPSQVIVKRLSTGARIVLKSHYSYEITKIDIFQDQYLVAHTPETLLMGDLASCKLSEIPWIFTSNEKYFFENPQVCMIFSSGELSLVEYGVNDTLATCRTEFMNPHLISVRLNERKNDEVKRLAYLADAQTIHVQDLVAGVVISVIVHDSRVDWLELSTKGNRLLFRDKRKQLHLFDVSLQKRTTVLPYCTYVQWVPLSDVVVAQSRGSLCIWYSIDTPERVTTFPIKGEIEEIERSNGRTVVIVEEGVNSVEYTLDEGLIEFGSAVDDKDYERAIAMLETLEMSAETEAMWRSLGSMAIKDGELFIGERCCAALKDVAGASYVRQLRESAEEDSQNSNARQTVTANLAALNKDFKAAERIYLEHDRLDEAMSMYQELHKWNLSIKVAETKHHPDLETLRRNYLQWLVESGQEAQAGAEKEDSGDTLGAIEMYLKGGMPARAAHLVDAHNLWHSADISERVAVALQKNGMLEKAGHLYQKLGRNDRALEAYKTGKVFRRAVELCREVFPDQVVALEEQWGDHLKAQKQMDAAVNHFIESGKLTKAVECALSARQWKRAAAILDTVAPELKSKSQLLQLAEHFASALDFNLAEKYYFEADQPQTAVDMLVQAGNWEKAYNIARSYMTQDDLKALYTSKATKMECDGRLKDAERLYVMVGEADQAISMYKNHKQYDQMLRMVEVHHSELLMETHLFLAKTLEADGDLKLAEQQFIDGKDWKGAVNMYCNNGSFEDGYRVAKLHGGTNAAKQVVYLWARSLNGEGAVKLLTKLGLLETILDFAMENGAFDFAFELSKFADDYKLLDIHYKQAMFLEDEGRFKEAEQAFVLSGKPREAILMYIHNEDWNAALSVAESHDAPSVPEILVGQAKLAFDKGEYPRGESLLLRAQRPELAIKFYKDQKLWKEALLFAKQYLPNRVSDLTNEFELQGSGVEEVVSREDIISVGKSFEQQRQYSKAIDTYLKASSKNVKDPDMLEQLWERAVEITLKFLPQRSHEVAGMVGARLLECKRYEQAGDLFAGVQRYKDAIDAFICGGVWDRARSLTSLAPNYKDYVEAAYVQAQRASGMLEKVVAVDINAGLDLCIQSGQWDKCLELAQQHGPDLLSRYLLMYCHQMLKEGKHVAIIDKCLNFDVPTADVFVDLYTQAVSAVLREFGRSSTVADISTLRRLLFKIISGPYSVKLAPLFQRQMNVAHLIALRDYCSKKPELQALTVKQSMSILRYTSDVPIDVALHDAATTAKAAGMLNVAFVCWNRYLDVADAIEERQHNGSNSDSMFSLIEDVELQDCTPDKDDLIIPSSNFLPDARREEIRDWVLQVSLGETVSRDLPKRTCESCGTSNAEAALKCRACRKMSEECVVTGYPITSSNRKQCTICSRAALKGEWNSFVVCERVCPWCGNSQAPTFS
ncbi:hypothetical protein M427DRAFT_121993 [Gonapodya prolifera JEL478]|uniref:Uncharacterized protein n=1 Tax=Gonapodya prolifera (strain JEL478) TaxID=1344416 RepID=A0A139ALJ8_GONPJ|nr:hypothetical protein M427DRAFT_121993 [Gonapodya prolifera JEL478]|eukprot:KXS17578.1 hypothetical protein M427DRAFT_121993 [Gonapodya prolifera JEL478]